MIVPSLSLFPFFFFFLIAVSVKTTFSSWNFSSTENAMRQPGPTTFNSGVVSRVERHRRLFESSNFEIIVRSHGISEQVRRKFRRRSANGIVARSLARSSRRHRPRFSRARNSYRCPGERKSEVPRANDFAKRVENYATAR